MLMRPTILFLTLGALSLASTAALAEPQGNSHPRFDASLEQFLAQSPTPSPREGGGKRGQWLEQLNLTNAQTEQLKTIRQKYKEQIEQLQDKIKTANQELGTMMAGTDSGNALRNKHAEVTSLRQQLDKVRFESLLEMRDVLTPSQRSQFAQMMQRKGGQLRDRLNRDR